MIEPTEDPTIYEVIREEHDEVSDLLEELASAEDIDTREGLFAEIRDRLERHARAEEAVFYEVLMKSAESRELAEQALRDHAEIRRLLGELDAMAGDDERWDTVREALAAAVREHVATEEDKVFTAVEAILDDDQVRTLAETFEAMELRVLPEEEEEGREPGQAA